jgi:transposase
VTWVNCFHRPAAVPPSRGATASRRRKHEEVLLALIDEQPDPTLDEVVCAMRRHRQNAPDSRRAVWRFFLRHKITFKKLRAVEQERADVLAPTERLLPRGLGAHTP